MAYTPTNWKTGDVVTAEKMNKLEQGVAQGGGGCMRVSVTRVGDGDSGTMTLDKTYAEMVDAIESGTFVYGLIPIDPDDNRTYIIFPDYYGYAVQDNRYVFNMGGEDYYCTSEDDLPSYSYGGEPGPT